MRTRWMRGAIMALCVGIVGLTGWPGVTELTGGPRARAASAFADPTFGTQWAAGEAVTPNFWGPLANAHVGVIEPWKEAPNGQRVVQYFDKGRMELETGNLASGVTSGLLATELVFGRVQTGTNSFDSRPPPAIAIAGDASNPGPTYAAFGGPAASLLAPATAKMDGKASTRVTAALNADGTITTFVPGADYVLASFTDFDSATKHNVVRAFATYRDKLGLTNIGYAVSEPFWSNLLVGGVRKAVLIQVFERRVLTYTPQNPTDFAVEIGNIGAQYYRWRYESTATDTPPVIAPTVLASPTTIVATTTSTTTTTTTITATTTTLPGTTAATTATPAAPATVRAVVSLTPVATPAVAGGPGGVTPSAVAVSVARGG